MHPVLNHWWQQNRPRFVYLSMYGETHAFLLIPVPVQDALLHVGEVIGDLVLAVRAVTCRDCFETMQNKVYASMRAKLIASETPDVFLRLAKDLAMIGDANDAMHREAELCRN
jgi:hypothetical protein